MKALWATADSVAAALAVPAATAVTAAAATAVVGFLDEAAGGVVLAMLARCSLFSAKSGPFFSLLFSFPTVTPSASAATNATFLLLGGEETAADFSSVTADTFRFILAAVKGGRGGGDINPSPPLSPPDDTLPPPPLFLLSFSFLIFSRSFSRILSLSISRCFANSATSANIFSTDEEAEVVELLDEDDDAVASALASERARRAIRSGGGDVVGDFIPQLDSFFF